MAGPGGAEPDTRAYAPIIVTGVIATALVVAAAFGVSALFTPNNYATWAGVAWMAAVPAQVVMALLWRFEKPAALGKLGQPWKGLAFTVLTVLIAALVTAGLVYGPAGGGVAPPPPMLIMYTIITIVTTLWWVIAFGAWPLSALKTPPLALGVLVWLLVYPIGYAIFRAAFNFEFMAGAPVYVAALDPKGAFMAWDALGVAVSSVAALLMLVLFEFWPIRHLPGGKGQPMQGVYAAIYCFGLGFGAFQIFTAVWSWDKVDYLVRAPVSYIFGFFLVNNMMQGRLLANVAQPAKGVALAVLAGLAAWGMGVLYRLAAPYVAQAELSAGPPGYQLELWVATAMLAVTFPLIIAYSGSMNFWPLVRRGAASA